jgi:SAM-dependent methyltransferase
MTSMSQPQMSQPQLRRLPVVFEPEGDQPAPPDGYQSLQEVTREIAFDHGWSPGRAERIRRLFDGLAPDWHTRGGPDRLIPLEDALLRSGLVIGYPCVEAGSGVGLQTPTLARKFSRVISFDISPEMLDHTPPGLAALVRADSAELPFRTGWVTTLVCVNMFLFPEEYARVLAPSGNLVFVSTMGAFTPIYLSPEEIIAALPGNWNGVTSQAAHGTWTVAQRPESEWGIW